MQPSALSPNFFCDVRRDRERTIVCVAGEFDIGVAPQVAATVEGLLETGSRRIVVDLRQQSFIDLAGVHMLIGADHSAQQRGTLLSLVRGSSHVHRVVELTGADSLFAFDDNAVIA